MVTVLLNRAVIVSGRVVAKFDFDRHRTRRTSRQYKIIDTRSQRFSTAQVTNIDFKSRAGDAGSLMDGAMIVKLNSKSYCAHRDGGQGPTSK